MEKQRVYVESSVISYLNPRLSRDPQKRIWQLQTAMWWERRHEWDCVLSDTVMLEIAEGDPGAAAQRLEKARSLVILPILPEMYLLSDALVTRKLVPESARPDAMHLAAAAIHRAKFLLTWNQKHLANPALRSRIANVIREHGWEPATVITPAELLKESK